MMELYVQETKEKAECQGDEKQLIYGKQALVMP